MKGICNCGAVSFTISGSLPAMYQCHCKLCQKQSGATANASTMVKLEQFEWSSGLEAISQWKKESGFSSHFCKNCGSPVPNPFRKQYMWIPAGLISETQSNIVAHICLNDKQDWDSPITAKRNYQNMPDDIAEFIDFLYSESQTYS
jgi:hypothetical protein